MWVGFPFSLWGVWGKSRQQAPTSRRAMARMPVWRKTGQRARESHYDGLEVGAWIEFPGYDSRNRQQGNLVAYLVEKGDDRGIGQGRMFEAHVVAVQDGYFDYWVEQTYGTFSLERVVPLHFCGVSQSRCPDGTMYRHPLHVDVFRILAKEQVLSVGWLAADDKARISAHPGLVGDAPEVGGIPPATTADPAGFEVQPGLAGIGGLAEALGAGDGLGSGPWGGEEKKAEKEKARGSKDGKEDLLGEIRGRSPAGIRDRSALELSRSGGSKDKKKRKRSSSSDDGSSDSSFQLAALPKGVEKIREMHRRHPGRLASMTLQRCSELLAQAHGGVMAGHEGAKLPAVARGYFQLIYLTAHPATEIGVRNYKELSTLVTVIDAVAGNESATSLGHPGSEAEGGRAGAPAGQLDAGRAARAGEVWRMVGSLQAGAQSGPAGGKDRLEPPAREPPHASMGKPVVERGRSRRARSRSRGRGSRRQGPGQQAQAEDEQRQGERQERQAPLEVGAEGRVSRPVAPGLRVRGPLFEIPILRQVIQGMPENIAEQQAQIDKHLESKELAELCEAVMQRVTTERSKGEVAFQFASLVVDKKEAPSETLLDIVERRFSVLVDQEGPQISQSFAELLGYPAPAKDASQEERGTLLETYHGVEIREWFPGWMGADGGCYVGHGGGGLTCSVVQEAYKDQLVKGLVKEALDGRPLYVRRDEVEAAKEVIVTYVLGNEAQAGWTEQVWRRWVGFWLLGRPSAPASFLGVVLCLGLRARPGPLGSFLRLLPCCAREHFKQTPVELLPMALPQESQALSRVMKVMVEAWAAQDLPSETWLEIVGLTSAVGVEAWTWLQVALLNFMWAGSTQILGRVLPHPAQWTKEQKTTAARLEKYSELFVAGGEEVEIGSWESVRRGLGEMYTGREVQKAYSLSWAAIEPHVPGPGEAGRISLSETVAPELKPYVEDPQLLRIPDQELGEVRKSAAVLVDSVEEYDLIVGNLVKAGMLEREVPAETLHIHGEPVYNGLFGVHKGWLEREDGSWLRTLRLIVNLIPSNQVQTRVPGQPSGLLAHVGADGAGGRRGDPLLRRGHQALFSHLLALAEVAGLLCHREGCQGEQLW